MSKPNVNTSTVKSEQEKRKIQHEPGLERRAFVGGLINELNDQISHYKSLTAELIGIQGRMEITERNLSLTRDHLRMVLGQTNEAVPADWKKPLDRIRFVGVRLGDAATEILREHKRLTIHEIEAVLDDGHFRFRTGTPLREINAALLRQPNVRREGEFWVYSESKKKGSSGNTITAMRSETNPSTVAVTPIIDGVEEKGGSEAIS